MVSTHIGHYAIIEPVWGKDLIHCRVQKGFWRASSKIRDLRPESWLGDPKP